MFKSFRSQKSAQLFHQPGLEYWFKERRTLIDFRHGPLESYVDGFAAYLKAKGYSYNWETKNASVLRKTASEKRKAWSFMAAQDRHPVMVV
jgi:hypothetical protein